MRLTPGQRTAAALAAATVFFLPSGTLYAFSVFLVPMEALLGVGRTAMSAVFALAAVTLTVGMNLAPRLYRTISPARLALACGLCSGAGLLLTALATTFAQFVLGYGVLFGFGAGVGFIVMQQGVNQTVSTHRGLANGYVVSLYPLGAMIGAPLIAWSLAASGLRFTLLALAVAMLAGGVLASALIRLAAIRMHDASDDAGYGADPQWPLFLRLSMVFFLAAAAGLMVMSQVAEIVRAYGGATVLAVGATTLITGAIAAARLGGGWLVDRYPVPFVAAGAHLWSFGGVAMLAFWPEPQVAVPALAMIGMGYGFVSGLTAGAIARYWHRNAFGSVASRLYIAWCVAALSLPVFAGWLYDQTQGYRAAVLIAGGVNLLGVYFSAGLPRGVRSVGPAPA